MKILFFLSSVVSKLKSSNETLLSEVRIALSRSDWIAAIRLLNDLSKKTPTDSRVWLNLGLCWRKMNLKERSNAFFQRSLICCPDKSNAWYEWRIFGKLAACDRAIKCAPNWPLAWQALGEFHHRQNMALTANLAFRRSLILSPANSNGWFDLSQSIPRDSLKTRMNSLVRSVLTDRAPARAYEHLAALMQENGNAKVAVSFYRKAIKILPNDANLHTNFAAALFEMGVLDKALGSIKKALILDQDLTRARWIRSWIFLSTGDLTAGFKEFDYRWHPSNAASRQHLFRAPQWSGGKLDGPLLIWGETGLGDEILFSGLVDEAATRCGQKIILECDSRLVSLFARAFPTAAVVGRQTPPAEALFALQPAAQCSSLRLPLFLRRKWTDFPHRLRYISATPRRRKTAWRRLKGVVGGLRVGLAWNSANARTGRRKSLPLAAFRPLIERCTEINFISLQYGDDGQEIAALRRTGLTNLYANPYPDLISDLDDLAAQIACLDGVVTISGINAHMAGALGRPAVVLMQKDPLWFWFRSGNVSPWYPSLRLLREDPSGGFASALEEAPAALREALGRD